MRELVSKDLLGNRCSQSQWILLSLFGLEHHALLLWIPKLALEFLVNMATWTKNGSSPEEQTNLVGFFHGVPNAH